VTRLGRRLRTAAGRSGVELTTRGQVEIDLSRVVDRIAAAAIGEVQRQTIAGRDTSDRPFRPYSDSYSEALERGGEGTNVDLLVTGEMLRSLREVARKIVDGQVAELSIGLVDTRSEQREFADGRAKRTGRMSPPHSRLGSWLHHGTGRMPARPWLGLSPSSRARVLALLRKSAIFRSRQ
jgi:hypothetical protein